MQTNTSVTVGDYVASRGHLVELSSGAPLFHEGDRSHSVYVCLSGAIRIFVTLPSGRELALGHKQPGEVFGEVSAIDGRPRPASAVTVEPSVVAQMPRSEFVDQLHDEPDLAIVVLRTLSGELRQANARLRAHNGESALVRCGHRLVELSSIKLRHDNHDTQDRQDRQDRHNGLRADNIELALTQADISAWIGATRESTARALARFREAGVIETGRGRIIVRDLPGLVALVEMS